MPLSAGDKLGPYEILALVGKGGMGEVYRARDPRLNREVAIKVSAAQFSERFEREAKAIAALNHPNLCQIYDVGPNYLVMEFIEGESPKGPMPLDEALRIAHQIADALEAAHDKGITHRDLKPGNIKIKPDGMVKVLDFGLAKVTAGPAASGENSPTLTIGMTQAGMILGTASYMAPEQARGKESVDKRADIWAFGVVLYELLTGQRPFDGEDMAETLAAVISKEPDLQQVPVKVRRLLQACLEKDPKQRLRDIADAKRLLMEEESVVTPFAPSPSRFGVVPWAIAALAVAGWAFSYWRLPKPVERPLIRLTADLGMEGSIDDNMPMALSPDGRRLAMVAQGADRTGRIWLRQLDQPQSVAVAETAFAGNPFFSPDGLWVGFSKDSRLWKISVQGGAPVALCEAPNFRGASWGSDGSILAALDRVGGLWRVPEGGGRPTLVTKANPQTGESSHRYPQILPGGAAVLFTAGSGNEPNANTLAVQVLKTGQRKDLWKGGTSGRYVSSGHLVFVYQNTLYAAPMSLDRLELTGQPQPVVEKIAVSPGSDGAWFDISPAGTLVFAAAEAAQAKQSVVRLDGSGQARSLFPGQGNYGAVRISPDSGRVVLETRQSGNVDIWVNELNRDAPTRLTFGSSVNKSEPEWSPDGRYVLFQTRGARGDGIGAVRADGGGDALQLIEQRGGLSGLSVSPDGKTIVFAELGAGTGEDLWTLPIDLTGGTLKRTGEPKPLLQTPANEQWPAVSSDGLWLAYTSDETGSNEVYVRPFPGGTRAGKWLVSSGGGQKPEWSARSKELFYLNRTGQITKVPYAAAGETFSAGKPQLWSSTVVAAYSAAPDGRSFGAVVDPLPNGQKAAPVEVTFMLNFLDDLRRRVPAGGK